MPFGRQGFGGQQGVGRSMMNAQQPPQLPQPAQPPTPGSQRLPPVPSRSSPGQLGQKRKRPSAQEQANALGQGGFGKWGSQENFDKALQAAGLERQSDARKRLKLWGYR